MTSPAHLAGPGDIRPQPAARPRASRVSTSSRSASMRASVHSRACAGWWNRTVACSTARPAAAGSTAVNSPEATPSAITVANWGGQGVEVFAEHDAGLGGEPVEVREQFRVFRGHAAFRGAEPSHQPPEPGIGGAVVVGGKRRLRQGRGGSRRDTANSRGHRSPEHLVTRRRRGRGRPRRAHQLLPRPVPRRACVSHASFVDTKSERRYRSTRGGRAPLPRHGGICSDVAPDLQNKFASNAAISRKRS
jgi:hypothetical protein